MLATVKYFEELLNEIAPFETCEGFDNVGLLVGHPDRLVTKAVVALDCTMAVVQEAQQLGAELIISHHPLMFGARKRLVETDPEACILCELIRNHISLVSAHTNLDQTVWSGSYACAKLLELNNISQDGYLFIGQLPQEMNAQELSEYMTQRLPMPVRLYGDTERKIQTLAIGGGACDQEWQNAQAIGAQALLTGEVKHHNALAAMMSGFVLYDGGHYGTEAPLVPNLKEYLQKRLDDVKYSVTVYSSQQAPFMWSLR